MAMCNEYRYGCVYRPPSMGALPKAPFRVEASWPEEEARSFYTRHGVVVFDRPLADNELVSFELAVLANETEKREIAEYVMAKMAKYRDGYLEMAEDEPDAFRSAVVTKAKNAKPYMVYLGNIYEFTERVRQGLL